MIDDLPLPVDPIIAVTFFGSAVNEIFFNVGWVASLNLNVTFLNSILPVMASGLIGLMGSLMDVLVCNTSLIRFAYARARGKKIKIAANIKSDNMRVEDY